MHEHESESESESKPRAREKEEGELGKRARDSGRARRSIQEGLCIVQAIARSLCFFTKKGDLLEPAVWKRTRRENRGTTESFLSESKASRKT